MSLRRRLASIIGDALTEEAAAAECQACGDRALLAFHEVKGVPTQSCVLLESETEARRYPTGDILLAFCESCGFIQNTRFDVTKVDYSKPTEESQAFSATFSDFAEALADRLVAEYRLADRSVLEVGCGKGDFLQLLAERGLATGIGIDPGYLPNRSSHHMRGVGFRREEFDGRDPELTADLVITRHLMEHVHNVGEFFGWLVEAVDRTPGAALFTEVPDVARVLAEGAFWDVYYEHCSYFTLGSLARSLRRSGLTVNRLELGFEGQYLLADASLGTAGERDEAEDCVDDVGRLVEDFAQLAGAAIRRWRGRIGEVVAEGQGVAVWGGGSKAVAFLTTLGVEDVTVVDINPHKQGKWLPGAAVRVQTPRVLMDTVPGLVIPMNPVYLEEITSEVRDMGIEAEVLSV